MRDWKQVEETNTLGEQMDIINENSKSSEFLDNIVDDIISNGYIYTGKETVGGKYIAPLTNVDLTGVVPSALYFDNFKLFFRTTNKIIDLDNFPVDLKSYYNGKPQFLYIREDLSYRVSDYMFGQVNEILIARFIINTDGTWNQFYIIPQRATSPLYQTGEEFYDLQGLNVKSPSGLELSTTEGSVIRSGIEFNDLVSPDIYKSTRLETTRVPIRYITNNNVIDYTQAPTYNIITDRYMEYDYGIKVHTRADEMIRTFLDSIYNLSTYANEKADELHTAITIGASTQDKIDIIKTYTDRIDELVAQGNELVNFLVTNNLAQESYIPFATQISLIQTDVESNLENKDYSSGGPTEIEVSCIRTNASYFNIIPDLLQDISDEIDEMTYPFGTIKTVPNGKFTVQRILWDVYEDCFILQYGNQVYDTFNDAAVGSSLLNFPAPYGKTIYIPTAIIIVKSGISSINNDTDTVIISRRWIYVDESYDAMTDVIAIAKADQAIEIANGAVSTANTAVSTANTANTTANTARTTANSALSAANTANTTANSALSKANTNATNITNITNGTTAVGKANTLRCTINGSYSYQGGDYFLNYNNFTNKVTVVNNLTTSSYDSTKALAAYQGYILKQAVDGKLPLSGGTLIGDLITRNIKPSTTETYQLGYEAQRWNKMFTNNLHVYNVAYFHDGSNSCRYAYSRDNSLYLLKAMAASDYTASKLTKCEVAFCW